jgi:hypothetical protein
VCVCVCLCVFVCVCVCLCVCVCVCFQITNNSPLSTFLPKNCKECSFPGVCHIKLFTVVINYNATVS